MGEKKLDIYAIVYESGRAETVMTGGSTNGPIISYWDVLERIYSLHQTSSFSQDYPKRLLRNGEPIEGRPIDLAWNYRQALNAAQAATLASVRAKHCPDWLKDTPND